MHDCAYISSSNVQFAAAHPLWAWVFKEPQEALVVRLRCWASVAAGSEIADRGADGWIPGTSAQAWPLFPVSDHLECPCVRRPQPTIVNV